MLRRLLRQLVFKLLPCFHFREGPVDGDLFLVGSFAPGLCSGFQFSFACDAIFAEALAGVYSDRDLSLVEPARVLGRVVGFKSSPDFRAFFFAEAFGQR